MKLSEERYVEACNENAGYCVACDDITEDGGVEPDAEGYTCPACDMPELMGIEQALLLGWLHIV